MPFAGKPILGIVGGIASGKSFVAGILRSLGCFVIDSDLIAHAVYQRNDVIRALRGWYGEAAFDPAGNVDRRAIGARVFRDGAERRRLESLVHPLIDEHRQTLMREHATDASVRAFVWDSPLLIEVGLHRQCDALLFIDTPLAVRLERVRATRGWDAGELDRREQSQLPLESKRQLASESVRGDLDESALRTELERLLERLIAKVSGHDSGGN